MKKAIVVITLSTKPTKLINKLNIQFSNYEIFSIIIRNESIDEKILELKNKNINSIIVLPLFVYAGVICNKAINDIKKYNNCFDIKILKPIINNKNDFDEINKILGNSNTIYCIHRSNIDLKMFGNSLIWQTGNDTSIVNKLKGIKAVNIKALMISTGYHFQNDVLNILKPALEKNGIMANVDYNGLADNDEIMDLIVRRIVNE